MNTTKKLSINPESEKDIASILRKESFELIPCENAFWRARKNSFNIIMYNNGTLLFQGSKQEIDDTINLIYEYIMPANTNFYSYLPALGLDESGKGDIFGPLVLAGALVTKENAITLIKAGVMDSKKLNDSQIGEIYREINQKIFYKIRLIEPAEYNLIYPEYGNLNILMAEEYKKLINQFKDLNYKTIILDKFYTSDPINKSIQSSSNRDFLIIEKAESYLPVATASIIARFHFIKWLKETSNHIGINLLKGSSAEATTLLKSLKKTLSTEELKKISKLHFKAGY